MLRVFYFGYFVSFLRICSRPVSRTRIVSIPRAFAWLAMGLSSVISIELVVAANAMK